MTELKTISYIHVQQYIVDTKCNVLLNVLYENNTGIEEKT